MCDRQNSTSDRKTRGKAVYLEPSEELPFWEAKLFIPISGIQPALHPQGNCISKHLQKFAEEGIIPSGAFEFSAQGAF
jgi:hypothetical protein